MHGGFPANDGFDDELDRSLAQLLPVLGPVFGVFLLLFAAWDYWIDPAQAALTLRIRVVMALLGMLAYRQGRLRWSAGWRCAWLYATQAGAMVACAALLSQGLMLALPGVTGAMFVLALIEPRPWRFMLAALAPSALLVLAAALTLPAMLFLNTVLLLGVSWVLALGVARANLRLRRRAWVAEQAVLHAVRHDSLSGALARGYVTELATHDVALARRHGRRLAVAMLDIDNFKQINDRHGHATGDLALSALVGACREMLRSTDYIGRIGGEEFVCVMPEAGTEDAVACAERIRTNIARLCLATDAGPLHFTVSIGVAVLGRQHADWPELLRAADLAMYAAKQAGRNRTVLAPVPDVISTQQGD
ncbi:MULTISPECIES: diguanylate cyclase [unclassified Massilia]|uniref:GGDEF domain-containing protein n=1 Tax=unclassified Massilia TaxID=2609279 RepID=UPI000A69DFF8|nr:MULTISPECIES: GGDEF domain-containing protein [unclassified Massilia]